MSRVHPAFAAIRSMPLTHSEWTTFSIVAMAVHIAKVITGSMTLSSNRPAEAASVTVRSSPLVMQ